MAANKLFFICMVIFPTALVSMKKIQENFSSKLKLMGMINPKTKE